MNAGTLSLTLDEWLTLICCGYCFGLHVSNFLSVLTFSYLLHSKAYACYQVTVVMPKLNFEIFVMYARYTEIASVEEFHQPEVDRRPLMPCGKYQSVAQSLEFLY